MASNLSLGTTDFHRFAAARLEVARKANEGTAAALNRILADTMMLRDIYKKYQWEVTGAAFYQLRAIYAVHHDEQCDLIDLLAERTQALGGHSIALATEVVECSSLSWPPRNPEPPQVQLGRLMEAHKRLLFGLRSAAQRVLDIGDDATHDLLLHEVIAVNLRQAMSVQRELRLGATKG